MSLTSVRNFLRSIVISTEPRLKFNILVDPTTGEPFSDSVGLATRALSQNVNRIGFGKAIASGVDSHFFEPAIIGAGQAVSQSGGNLIITSGTTARSETLLRSVDSWKGGIRLRTKITLSQRIINQNFIVELVDIIGDSLAYNITSAPHNGCYNTNGQPIHFRKCRAISINSKLCRNWYIPIWQIHNRISFWQ